MKLANSGHNEFLVSISKYLDERRRFAVQGILETTHADAMLQVFREYLPQLSTKLQWTLPNAVYSKHLINFAVAGLNETAYQQIWENYFLGGQSLRYVASLIKYSERNTRRLILKLPYLVEEQLIEKNHEILNHDYVDPMTDFQKTNNRLMRAFGITLRQAEILRELSRNDRILGQKEICANLNISPSGLKKHVRRIIRKLNVGDRQQAVQKVRNLLGDSEPE